MQQYLAKGKTPLATLSGKACSIPGSKTTCKSLHLTLCGGRRGRSALLAAPFAAPAAGRSRPALAATMGATCLSCTYLLDDHMTVVSI